MEIQNFSSHVEKRFHSFTAQRNFVSPSGHVHVMFYLLYKHQWNTKPFHLDSFWCERHDLLGSHSNGDKLFSHVKITCYFHMWRYQDFMQKLIWYFIGVYIIILVFNSENDLNKVIIQHWKLLLDIGHCPIKMS